MADQLSISGGYSITPLGGVPSFAPNVDAIIDETLITVRKTIADLSLTTDSPVPVNFGGVVNAHVVLIRAVGGKVRVRVTSADGSSQSFPVDPALVLESLSVPITAIDLTRVPATPTDVRIVLGEKA